MQIVTPLRKKKLVREIQAKSDMPVWRRDEKQGLNYALVITRAGRDAVDIKPDNRSAKVADQHAEVRASSRRPPNKIKNASGDERSTPKPSTNSSATPAPRTGSKLALIVKMLGRVHGVSIDDLTKATEWLPHTARAVITSLRNKGYRIETERNPDKKTVYRIISADKAASHSKAA